MRSFRHWTPRYFKNRLATLYYEKANPNHPWLTRSANEILDSYLIKSDVGLEFGSGRSTAWIARRIGHLTSVEHNYAWAAKVQGILNEATLNNVDYKSIPKDVEEEQGNDSEYVKVVDAFDTNSLDFCLVDGIYRDFCALKVIDKLRPGGLLVIDNANWYLLSRSYSPNSRSFTDGPKGTCWKELAQLISVWRKIWTSSGVTDTAMFFKPYN